jgi:biotin operon repressor
MAKKKPRPEVIVLPNGDIHSGAYVTRVLTPGEAADVQAKAEALAANPVGSLKRCRDSSIETLRDFIVSPEQVKELCSQAERALNETPEVAALETSEGTVFVAVPPTAPPEIRDHLELVSLFDQLIPLAENGGEFMEVLGLGIAVGKVLERLQLRGIEVELLRKKYTRILHKKSGWQSQGVTDQDVEKTQRLVAEAMARKIKYHPACQEVAAELGVNKKTVMRRYPNPNPRNKK